VDFNLNAALFFSQSIYAEFFGRAPLGVPGPGTRRPGRRELTELYYSQVGKKSP